MKNERGLTLVEVVVAGVILSVGILVAINSFSGIAKTIFISQTRQVATALAREKLESLQVLPYYRLPGRTPTGFNGGTPAALFQYDAYYTPGPETVKVGAVTYRRGAYVERVYRDPGDGRLRSMDASTPYQTEMGLKRIQVSVSWQENRRWRTVNVTGLKENPVRTRGEVEFVGTVRSTDGLNLANIQIEAIETLSQASIVTTNAAGEYRFMVRPGSYTIRARDTNQAYFTKKQLAYVSYENNPSTVNFQLQRFQFGTVSATFWWNSSPLISRIMGSYADPIDGFKQEWVEIFNPTTWTWRAQDLHLHYYYKHNSSEPASGLDNRDELHKHRIDIGVYHRNLIEPGTYYLFANTGTLRFPGGVTVQADAEWDVSPGANWWFRADRPDAIGRFYPDGGARDIITVQEAVELPNQRDNSSLPPFGPLPKYKGGGGYLRLSYSTNAATAYHYVDGVGWRGGLDGSGTCTGDVQPVRGEEIPLEDNVDTGAGLGIRDCKGLDEGEQWIRYASTMAVEEAGDYGPAYDSNCNLRDFGKYDAGGTGGFARLAPRNNHHNASLPMPIVSGRDSFSRSRREGTPDDYSNGGYVNAYVNDGLSVWGNYRMIPTYFTGTTPGTGTPCAGCPRTNMFASDNLRKHPWWGKWEFPRVSTGVWTLGMFARRKIGPFDYRASSHVLLNVEPGTSQHLTVMLTQTTNTFHVFGQVLDFYNVPIEDVDTEINHGGGPVAYVKSRSGGAFSLSFVGPGPTTGAEVKLNDRTNIGYQRSYQEFVYNDNFHGGEGVRVNAMVDSRLGYTGFLRGHVKDSLGTPIPEVVVSAVNAATREERGTGITDSLGNFRIFVATGNYLVRALTELEETVLPLTYAIDLTEAVATGSGDRGVFTSSFTISNAYGRRSGSVTMSSEAIPTGVLLVLSTQTITSSSPPVVTAQLRASNRHYFMASSDSVGRYSFDVRMATYNLYAFYPYFRADGTLIWQKIERTGQYVNSGSANPDFLPIEIPAP